MLRSSEIQSAQPDAIPKGDLTQPSDGEWASTLDLANTAIEILPGNGGRSDSRGSFYNRHPISGKLLDRVELRLGDRRPSITGRVRTITITSAQINNTSEDSSGWRRLDRTVTISSGVTYPWRLYFRHRDSDSSYGFSFQDFHSGRGNTYGEVYRAIAYYK